MKFSKFLLAGALVLSLGACEGNQYGQKQTAGAVLGGIVGGLSGAQVGSGKGQLAATALGTLVGVVIGSEVGKSLDKADKLYAQQTAQTALETNQSGQTSSWRNPDSGHGGSITPTRTYQTARGESCREYQQTVTIAGRTESAYGRACRDANGTWRLMN